MQVMTSDDDLITVGERAPFNALTVDEHAVEAAVVQYAQPIGLAHDERMST
jgi:hypothetical protein